MAAAGTSATTVATSPATTVADEDDEDDEDDECGIEGFERNICFLITNANYYRGVLRQPDSEFKRQRVAEYEQKLDDAMDILVTKNAEPSDVDAARRFIDKHHAMLKRQAESKRITAKQWPMRHRWP